MLSIESIGTRCSNGVRPSTGWSPMRCVGLSGVTSSGCSASSFLSRSTSRSYSRVADLGGRLDVVFPVVAADFLAEPGDFGGGSGIGG